MYAPTASGALDRLRDRHNDPCGEKELILHVDALETLMHIAQNVADAREAHHTERAYGIPADTTDNLLDAIEAAGSVSNVRTGGVV